MKRGVTRKLSPRKWRVNTIPKKLGSLKRKDTNLAKSPLKELARNMARTKGKFTKLLSRLVLSWKNRVNTKGRLYARRTLYRLIIPTLLKRHRKKGIGLFNKIPFGRAKWARKLICRQLHKRPLGRKVV